MVNGSSQPVPVCTLRRSGKARLPAVVTKRTHGCGDPVLFARRANQQACFHMVVAVAEYIGLDDNNFADDALGRKASGIDLRHNMFNGHPVLPTLRLW